MTKRIRYFNMIEVLLALTVIAIGMTSILGLFPVGLNASRNAVAENCSSDIADQLITYFRVVNEIGGTGYTDNFINAGYSETNTPTDADVATQSADFLRAYSEGNIATGDAFERLSSGWAIFKSPVAGMFFVVQGPNCLEDAGERPIDFSAMALISKSTVQIKRLNPGGDPSVATDWALWPSPASYVHSGKLNIELSWPLELPYSERKKRYYQIVINKP